MNRLLAGGQATDKIENSSEYLASLLKIECPTSQGFLWKAAAFD